jgi:hypothetical protein
METISAKQVDGAVDTSTEQNIGGVKSFTSPVNFIPENAEPFVCMRMEGLYLYWLKDQSNLYSEGDLRLGPGLNTEALSLQKFQEGQWQEPTPSKI